MKSPLLSSTFIRDDRNIAAGTAGKANTVAISLQDSGLSRADFLCRLLSALNYVKGL